VREAGPMAESPAGRNGGIPPLSSAERSSPTTMTR
jgi:hypothetical protein